MIPKLPIFITNMRYYVWPSYETIQIIKIRCFIKLRLIILMKLYYELANINNFSTTKVAQRKEGFIIEHTPYQVTSNQNVLFPVKTMGTGSDPSKNQLVISIYPIFYKLRNRISLFKIYCDPYLCQGVYTFISSLVFYSNKY